MPQQGPAAHRQRPPNHPGRGHRRHRGLGCTGETARITFTLADGGKLAYASQDAKGGKPTATLARTGG
ncbi:hypothetical protein ACFQ2B_13915 [Streptomyces stramineus]